MANNRLQYVSFYTGIYLYFDEMLIPFFPTAETEPVRLKFPPRSSQSYALCVAFIIGVVRFKFSDIAHDIWRDETQQFRGCP